MRVQNTTIPQAALDAGRTAMTDGFKAVSVQAAISAVLRADADFRYPGISRSINADDMFDMRVADHLIQARRRAGEIAFAKGRWTVRS